MKKSINAWSVDGAVGFEEMFSQMKAVGFEGIELNVDKAGHSAHSLTMETTAEELTEIKALADKYDLPVVSISSSLYAGNMGSPDPECREFAKKLLRKQLECAKALGAGGILVVPGGIEPDGSHSIKQAYENSLETLASLKDVIYETKINVGVENVWNGFFMSPYDMMVFIDKLDCPYLGAYYDVGNVIAFSWSEYWIEILGTRIKNVHVKDFKRNTRINSGGTFTPLLKGDTNWKAVIPALRKAGFDGYLTAEVFKAEDESYEDFYKSILSDIEKMITEN